MSISLVRHLDATLQGRWKIGSRLEVAGGDAEPALKLM
jgi:hypothetical protein